MTCTDISKVVVMTDLLVQVAQSVIVIPYIGHNLLHLVDCTTKLNLVSKEI